jgi:DNA polymerase III subunit gamma/tau
VNLAERMRPKTLEEIIGNTHIVAALKKQFETDTLSQTIMFTGAAGQGKTTFAKIIASHLKAELIEIDCGADGSIDNMRELVESASLSSLFSKSKVFILDEVHALSKPGQSALLKTLEEPQKNVHFILLTNEPTKILNTIKTRCVEYQTMPASKEDIGEAVRRVEKLFNISFENRADLWSLVEQSKGSLRQVYSFLEKLIASANSNGIITSDMFHSLLGKSMEHVSENLPLAFLKNDLRTVISAITDLKKESVNPTGTLIGVYNYLKVVMLKDIDLIPDGKKRMMGELAERISQKDITWETLESIAWKYL